MIERKKCKLHSAEFKAKVGLEAVGGVKAINEISQEFGAHPVQVSQWKKEIQTQCIAAIDTFGARRFFNYLHLLGGSARATGMIRGKNRQISQDKCPLFKWKPILARRQWND